MGVAVDPELAVAPSVAGVVFDDVEGAAAYCKNVIEQSYSGFKT